MRRAHRNSEVISSFGIGLTVTTAVFATDPGDMYVLRDDANVEFGGVMDEKIEWLKNWFRQKIHIDSIQDMEHANYLERRLIDSVSVIELVVAAEERFEIGFTGEVFDDPRFSTIAGLAQIIAELEERA